MRRKRFLMVFALCSIMAMLLGAGTIYAQTPSPAVISSYTIRNIDGSDVTEGPLMAGATYTVSLEINVGFDLPDTQLKLSTPMEKVEDVFWRLTNEYTGIDTAAWQPGQPTIEFNAIRGTAQLTAKGRVPSDYTQVTLADGEIEETLHLPKSISLIELSLGTEVLDDRPVEVIDQSIVIYRQTLTEKQSLLQNATPDLTYANLAAGVIILAENLSSEGFVENAIDLLNTLPGSAAELPTTAEYEQLLNEKNSLLQSVTSDPAYERLVEGMIALSEDFSGEGNVQGAIDLLDSLPGTSSDFPTPVTEKSFLPYLIVIIVLAVVLITFFILFFKARAGSGFVRQQVDEEAGKLDVLSVRVSRIDKQLAADLERVKEHLERISGR